MSLKISTRVHALSKPAPQVISLSLLDATTANFALTSAIWLFDASIQPYQDINLSEHLRKTLGATLNAYPQWTGQIKAITSTDGSVPDEAAHLPAHARRFGRIYTKFGYEQDPGVSFTTATCSSTLAELYPISSRHAVWELDKSDLNALVSQESIADPFHAHERNETGVLKPVMAIQLSELACGGFALAVKIAHPLADISALATFMKNWGAVSRAALLGDPEPVLKPVFDPSKLDRLAAGDIDSSQPSSEVLKQLDGLPLHRYDWWASAATCPWGMTIPEPFTEDVTPAGRIMPWTEWDVSAPVARSIIRFTHEQVDLLWKAANSGSMSGISRHDAIVAHVWSCITRARKTDDSGPVHCDLVYGVRSPLQLGSGFVGSPMFMINVEMAADVVGTEGGSHLHKVAGRIRETIRRIQPSDIAVHLHSIAYEKSPQRIWQAFLGRRHVMLTSWTRAGVYDVDFGLGLLRYVDDVMPSMDGIVVVKEGAGPGRCGNGGGGWTENGVDVDVRIGREDMERLLDDAMLLP